MAWLIIIAGTIACRALYLDDVIYNIDEAEYAVAADGLNQGWLPGVDLLGSTKPPGIAVLYNQLFQLFGRSMAPLRIAQLLLTILAGLLTVEIAAVIWGRSAIVPTALFYWMVANAFSLPEELLSLSVETPGLVFAMFAVWLCLIRRSRFALVISGISLGLALLFRQSFLPFVLPMVLAIETRQQQRRAAIWIGIGALLVWGTVLGIYATRGALSWCWDSWVRYPLTYSGDLGIAGFLSAFFLNFRDFALQAPIPLAGAAAGVFALAGDRSLPRRAFLLALALASLIALSAGSRFYGHYFIQTFPAFALLCTAALIWLWRRGLPAKSVVVLAVGVGVWMAAQHFPNWRTRFPGAPPRGVSFYALGRDQLELKLGAFARANTTPEETILVWGYCPQIYYHAERLPGVRDYLCHYLTGYSPSAFDPYVQRAPRERGHPLAEEMFVEDLERRTPKYIFDLVQITDYEFTFYHYSLRDYAKLRDYLIRNYAPDQAIGDALVYRRRTPEDDRGQP
ncbi:glycosyltransferase family 39 protein [candidate division KSB1 bacterium]|nr:glycosyltransferase family 39 protein [candidate division KSB1 bacterium]